MPKTLYQHVCDALRQEALMDDFDGVLTSSHCSRLTCAALDAVNSYKHPDDPHPFERANLAFEKGVAEGSKYQENRTQNRVEIGKHTDGRCIGDTLHRYMDGVCMDCDAEK